MSDYLIKGQVYLDGKFQSAVVAVKEEKISNITQDNTLEENGLYIIPGFIDMHIHGVKGNDFCDGTREAFMAIASFLAENGVTGFLGTSMSYGEERLGKIFAQARDYMVNQPEGIAQMLGINMEGPFISKSKKGAQAEDNIINPDFEMFMRLYDLSGKSVKLIDLAPELDGGEEFIKSASKITTVSLAHTESDYDTAVRAYKAGAKNLTHLFNAMPPFNHRAPGIIGAAMDFANTIELICDGVHSRPSAVRAAFKLFGRDRICLISDAMRACGMPEGKYDLGGQSVFVSDGKATLADGTIAGSSTLLSECVRRAILFGISPKDAIHCATEVPAKSIGIWDKTGSIEVGKFADIVLLDSDYKVCKTMVRGKWV